MLWGLDARGYLASRLEDGGRTVSSDDIAAVPLELRGDRLGAGLTIVRTFLLEVLSWAVCTCWSPTMLEK